MHGFCPTSRRWPTTQTLLPSAGCDTRRSDQLAVIVCAVDAGVHPIPWLSVSTNECRATRDQGGAPHFQSFRHCTSLTFFIPVLRLNIFRDRVLESSHFIA